MLHIFAIGRLRFTTRRGLHVHVWVSVPLGTSTNLQSERWLVTFPVAFRVSDMSFCLKRYMSDA